MALDTGSVRHLHLNSDAEPDEGFAVVGQPSVDEGVDIGAALRAARTFRGLTTQDVADATRIRLSYIDALEDLRMEELPSRPFTIGYVRAYAQLLGLDGEAAVLRFKSDVPDDGGELRAPVGVRHERDPRLALVLIVGLLMVGAILLWNVAQRAMDKDEPAAQVAANTAAPQSASAPAGSAVSLGAPLPAPVESTTPEPYKTPGLDDAAANGGSADAANAASKARATAVAAGEGEIDAAHVAALGSTFKPRGVIHGAAAADSSGVVLLARKAATLVVRGADGSVYFARQLNAGEAFRAPRTAGLTADVSDPSNFDVYSGGVLTGRLTASTTALGKLAKPAA
ncbi:helix-turn-helix domain-containing protein [Caulobacter sp. ErkDOM-YI]|uniref:helix-turn-helix domain-containing protein n=1 Tax=unclassified Caulobacter TaxID=2648921 RepID=UPI003AF68FF1